MSQASVSGSGIPKVESLAQDNEVLVEAGGQVRRASLTSVIEALGISGAFTSGLPFESTFQLFDTVDDGLNGTDEKGVFVVPSPDEGEILDFYFVRNGEAVGFGTVSDKEGIAQAAQQAASDALLSSQARAASEQAASEAEIARDIALDAVFVTFFADDQVAREALVTDGRIEAGQRVFQKDTGYIYEFQVDPIAWVDLGESQFAIKANKADLDALAVDVAGKVEVSDLADGESAASKIFVDAIAGRFADGALVKDETTGKSLLSIEPLTGRLNTVTGVHVHKDMIGPDGLIHLLALLQDDGSWPLGFAQSPNDGRVSVGLPDEATRRRWQVGEFAGAVGFGSKIKSKTLQFVGSTGQSLEVGGGLDTGAIDDTSQLAPMFIQHPLSPDMAMLDTGLIWTGSSAIPTVTDLVPAREAFRVNGSWRGQSQGSGYMMQAEMLYREEDGVIHPQAYFAFGRGGTGIADLDAGSQSFLNGIAGITAAYNLAADYGLDFNYVGTCWTHGHSDRNLDYATYLSFLIALKDELTTEINTVTGGDGTYPFVMFQLCAGGTAATGSGSEPNTPALAVLEAADTEADMFVIGPTYQFATVDGTHGDAVSYDMMGEMASYVMKKVKRGTWGKACEITGVSRAGTTITVTVNVPEGDLVIDETTLPSATDYGFTYSGANITNVSVGTTSGGSCDVTVTIDADAGGVLNYAWTGPGVSRDPETGLYPHASAWGNLRDDTLIPCVTHGNKRLAHWLCAYETTIA